MASPGRARPDFQPDKEVIIVSGIARTVVNNVETPRWMAAPRGKAHAFLVPAGDLPAGEVRALCPVRVDAARLADTDAPGNRCRTCTRLAAPDTRKRGTGLTEPKLPVVDAGATAAPVIGARDGSVRMDGPALVQGPYMRPVQPTWTNPVTHEVEPAAARLDGSLRERADRDPFVPRVGPKRTASQKRKYRARKLAEQCARDRARNSA